MLFSQISNVQIWLKPNNFRHNMRITNILAIYNMTNNNYPRGTIFRSPLRFLCIF